MRRLLIIYNPRSSRFSDVKNEVLSRLTELKGYMVGKYEVANTNVDDNTKKLAKILKNDDLVVAAGGDATAVIAANAILQSDKNITLAVLPYGNFNDLSRTLGTETLEDVVTWTGGVAGGTPAARSREASTAGETATTGPVQKLYPLEIYIDDKFFRYATCYVTIGMTAEAVELFDKPKVRKKLKTSSGRSFGSYLSLASWYFKNRHRKVFLPEFRLNGELQHRKTSDYAAVNGSSMARVMKGGDDYQNPTVFRSETDRLTSFWRLVKLLTKSILSRIPGSETKGDILEFIRPSTVELQAEGEYTTFENINKIEIKKGKKCLKVVKK